MRIIAGLRKGKKLFSPDGNHTRPTSDRMREAVFSMIGEEILGSTVLDLFAGTGALGLEALSRGAGHCTFVDNSPEAILLLKKNVDVCQMKNQSVVIQKNVDIGLSFLSAHAPFSFVFMDPPYGKENLTLTFQWLHEYHLLSAKATLIVETAQKKLLSFPNAFFTLQKERVYGKSKVSFLQYLI